MMTAASPPPVSAVIITRDAAETLAATLDSLVRFPEVVIYDNGSSDGSREVASRYPNVRWHEGPFEGFGPTKQRAVALASADWVFSIDADEVATPALVDEILGLSLDDPAALYVVNRHNYLMGRHVRHAGWGNDWLARLFHRGVHNFNEAPVHENIEPAPGATCVRLSSPLQHAAVRDLGDFLRKTDRYSGIRARHATRALPAAVIYLKALWAFFRTWVLQLGFLCGWRGLVIAWSNANGVFFKHMKALARFEREGKS
jgi:glycosyltransferase involved in cell wall biosynthesis